jgi:hypothetical protein
LTKKTEGRKSRATVPLNTVDCTASFNNKGRSTRGWRNLRQHSKIFELCIRYVQKMNLRLSTGTPCNRIPESRGTGPLPILPVDGGLSPPPSSLPAIVFVQFSRLLNLTKKVVVGMEQGGEEALLCSYTELWTRIDYNSDLNPGIQQLCPARIRIRSKVKDTIWQTVVKSSLRCHLHFTQKFTKKSIFSFIFFFLPLGSGSGSTILLLL